MRGFGMVSVTGRSRVPSPAASTIPERSKPVTRCSGRRAYAEQGEAGGGPTIARYEIITRRSANCVLKVEETAGPHSRAIMQQHQIIDVVVAHHKRIARKRCLRENCSPNGEVFVAQGTSERRPERRRHVPIHQ